MIKKVNLEEWISLYYEMKSVKNINNNNELISIVKKHIELRIEEVKAVTK